MAEDDVDRLKSLGLLAVVEHAQAVEVIGERLQRDLDRIDDADREDVARLLGNPDVVDLCKSELSVNTNGARL